MSDLLRRAAERAARSPVMLASALLPYARAEGLDDAALAARIGCPPERLAELLWCRRPAPNRFRADVERIAAHFQLNAGELAAAIRMADAIEALRSSAHGPTAAAARDHNQREPEAP